MAMIERWEQHLAAAIIAARDKPFIWGQHDCAIWAFDLRRALTDGPDHASLWRGKYKTALGAERVMRRLGWSSYEAGARALLGEPRAYPLLAQRGDLVLGAAPEAFGICLGAKVAFAGPKGLTFAPIATLRLAWEP
jgi:hypothetical protein